MAGGSERTLGQVSRGLAERGYSVTVFTARYPGSSRTEHSEGVRIRRRGGRLTVYLWGFLHTLLGRYDDVIDVQNGIPFFAAVARPRRSVLLVHHVHREQWPVATGPLTARVGWFVESRVSPRVHGRVRCIAMSSVTKDELVSLGFRPERVTVVHNGSSSPPCGWDPSDEPSLVVVSRLVPHKQVDHAIDLLTRLADRFPGLRLVIVGEGYDRDRLEAHVAAAGVTDRVDFAGYVDDVEKYRALSRGWIHVFPSIKEGWGLVAVEAASVGVPTLAYWSAGGVRESVRHGETGFLAENPEDMEEHARRILGDATLRSALRDACLAHANRTSWDATVDAFEGVLVRQVPRAAGALPVRGDRA